MIDMHLGKVLRYIRRVTAEPGDKEPTDGQLLTQFVQSHDEAAFALLVERHGGMVLAVCQRMLRDRHEAEDVFQATFLVLARKAGAIRQRESVASWLHGVAYRMALKTRVTLALKYRRQRMMVPEVAAPENEAEMLGREVRPILDEELSRLPEKYRLPLVLCYLEGKTNAEAAQVLGWPRGTVAGRLARAREQMRRRLVRRGLGVTPALLTAILCEQAAPAAVSGPQLVATVNAVCNPAAAVASGNILTLADGVLRTMFFTKAKIVAGVVLALSVLTGSMVLMASGYFPSESDQPALLTGVGGTAPGLPFAEKEKLQGSWQSISAQVKGVEVPEMTALKMTFQGDKVFIVTPAKSGQGTVSLFPEFSPKRIDIKVEGEKGMGLGIFKVEGDKLYLSIDDYNDGRPTSFSSEPGTKHTFLILKRTSGGTAKVQGTQTHLNKLMAENEKLRDELNRLQDELTMLKSILNKTKYQDILQAMKEMQKVQELHAAAEKQKAEELARLEKMQYELALQQKQKADAAFLDAQKASEAAKRQQSMNNLKQIGLAMHNYHDQVNSLPAAAIYSKKGEPLLSWRVAILPYIEHDALYRKFNLEEPWNSPHNIKLLDQMPKLYAPVGGSAKDKTSTPYQVFTGPKTMFQGLKGLKFLQLVVDGTSNTIMATEGAELVPWTKPADLVYDAKKTLPKLGGMFKTGFNVLLGDGSVRFLSNDFDEPTMRNAISIDDGQIVEFDKLTTFPKK